MKSGYGCDREEHGSGLKEPAIKECKATFGDILWPGTQGSVLVFPRLVLDATLTVCEETVLGHRCPWWVNHFHSKVSNTMLLVSRTLI